MIERRAWRERDRLGRSLPARLNMGGLVAAIPGLLEQFDRDVPASYVSDEGLRCVCGTVTSLKECVPVECAGACGRFFLQVGSRVRCAAYPPETLEEAA